MNRNEFIELLVSNGSCKTKKEAKELIVNFTSNVEKVIASGKDLSILGFGAFKVSLRKGRTAAIPNAKKVAGKIPVYTAEDKMAVRFKVGKKLKDAAGALEIVKVEPVAVKEKAVAPKKVPAVKKTKSAIL